MDKMPKRRKDKDNPYTLLKEGNNYYVLFKDSTNKENMVPISLEIFEIFNSFELEDISRLHKVDKYIERNLVYEETLMKKGILECYSVELYIEKKDSYNELKTIIKKLPTIQRTRLIKYYFNGKTLEQIANEEGCTKRAVKFSIDIALNKILKEFKK